MAGMVTSKASTFIQRLTPKVRAAARSVLEAAAERAREDCPVRTGDLQSTIRTEDRSTRGLNRITMSLKAGGMAGKITGNYVNYARYVNDGTPHQAANPFLTRAGMWLRNNFHRKFRSAMKQ